MFAGLWIDQAHCAQLEELTIWSARARQPAMTIPRAAV
jgi:hypothetical protein